MSSNPFEEAPKPEILGNRPITPELPRFTSLRRHRNHDDDEDDSRDGSHDDSEDDDIYFSRGFSG